MKKSVLVLLIVIAGSCISLAQSTKEIEMTKVFGGYKFTQDESTLTVRQLVETMKENNDAYNQMKAARSTFTFGSIVGGAGGFMVGYPIGTALGGGDPNWLMAGIGAGLILVTIPITQKFNKQAKNAVEIYNSGLNSSSYCKPIQDIRLGATSNGIGLVMNF